jgi:hypothetical protein
LFAVIQTWGRRGTEASRAPVRLMSVEDKANCGGVHEKDLMMCCAETAAESLYERGRFEDIYLCCGWE